jgi:hypothetical protein
MNEGHVGSPLVGVGAVVELDGMPVLVPVPVAVVDVGRLVAPPSEASLVAAVPVPVLVPVPVPAVGPQAVVPHSAIESSRMFTRSMPRVAEERDGEVWRIMGKDPRMDDPGVVFRTGSWCHGVPRTGS